MVFASSHWLVWLGQAIVSNLIVASLLAIIATIVGWRLRRPALAHGLWVLVLVKLVTPPLVTVTVPVPGWMDFSHLATVSQSTSIAIQELAGTQDQKDTSLSGAIGLQTSRRTVERGLPAVSQTALVGNISFWLTNMLLLLLASWFIAAHFLMMRSLLRSIRFARVLQAEGRECAEATKLGLQMAEASGIDQCPRILLVSANLSPMLFGFSRWATIVVPSRLWDGLDNAQRSAMLAHELAHYKRGDHWVRGLELVVGSLFFWFPLVRIARTQIERMEETCCDLNAVEALDQDRRLYAESLLQVVDYISQRGGRMPGLASGMRPTITLEERLRSIMNNQATGRMRQRHRSLLGALALLVVLLHPLASASPNSLNARLTSSSIEGERTAGAITDVTTSPREARLSGPLPEAPRGWWNEKQNTSVIGTLAVASEPKMRLSFNPGVSIEVIYSDESLHPLAESAPTAMATLHHAARLIVGNNKGDIRIWDVESQQSVSWIGHHEGPVTTLCYHPKFGLLSGDGNGLMLQWEIQSGAIQNSLSLHRGPIQSIRCNRAGDQIAIVFGDWRNNESSRLVFLDSSKWIVTNTMDVPAAVATLFERDGNWHAVDWLGYVYPFPFQQKMGRIPKVDVSALSFAQDATIPDLQSVPLEISPLPFLLDFEL